GCDFKQHAARGAEVDCPEVIAVNHRRDMIARVHQRLAHFKLCSPVRYGKGDVVDRTCALTCSLCRRKGFEINRIGTIAIWNDEAADIAFGFSAFITHELEQFGTGVNVMKPHACAAEAADSDIFGNARTDPWRTLVVVNLNQCKAIAI